MLVCFFHTESFNFRFYLLFLTAHGSLVARHHFINSWTLILHGTLNVAFEPFHEKTNILHMRKRRRRSALR